MKDTTITFRLSETEKQKIVEMAAKRDIPVSQLVRELCRESFQKENKGVVN